MLSFKQFLNEEHEFMKRLHSNCSLATLKKIARNNKYGNNVRYVVHDDGTVYGAHPIHFYHHQMVHHKEQAIAGLIKHEGKNDYTHNTYLMNHSKKSGKHPFVKRIEKQGIKSI